VWRAENLLRRPEDVAQVAALALGFALLLAPWFGHFDDTDAQLYQVVARKMAAQRAWLDPAYLDHLYPRFREQLPFGFWPFAAAIALFGEPAARAVAALFSLATLAGVALAARRLIGAWPAVLATFVLATTDTFFRYGGETRLDPLLVLLANAAAWPILVGPASRRSWLVATGIASLAMLVKGPFGLVPFLAAACARAWADRSLRPMLYGMGGAAVACLPLMGFLLLDDIRWHAGWWDGYFRSQLLSSATGARPDGNRQLWYPLATVAGRFWPGLPFMLWGIGVSRRSRAAAVLGIFCAAMLIELCIPGRKVWNHALVAYPGLSLLAGAGSLPALEWIRQRGKSVAAAVCAVSLAGIVAAPRIGRLVDGAPCTGSAEFAPALDALGPGETILVVSQPTSWRTLASLSAERRLEPVPLAMLPAADAASAKLALVEMESLPAGVPEGWRELLRARGWILLQRR
jgi:4-amino-4-deoxy-L-arabinose transferase-like glycosyltransferase